MPCWLLLPMNYSTESNSYMIFGGGWGLAITTHIAVQPLPITQYIHFTKDVLNIMLGTGNIQMSKSHNL